MIWYRTVQHSLHFCPSLRQLLPILFFLLAAIPAGAIGLLLTDKAWEREIQKVHEQHLLLARHVAEALIHYAEDVAGVFQLTAINIAANRSVQELTSTLDRLHFKQICIVDDTGKVLHLIALDPELTTDRVSECLFDTMLTAGSKVEHLPTFSHVLPDRHGDPTIFLRAPLNAGRYALGVLKTDYFVHLQNAISFGKKGHATIVDQSGRILAHPNPEWRTQMRDISQLDPVRRMMQGEMGVSWFYSPALQANMVAGFTTIPKTGWGVMILQPLSELEGYVRQGKQTVWSVIGIALCVASLLGWLVSRWLAAPLRRIGHVAERFANGAYDARIGDLGMLSTREVTVLAAQFNAMAEEVKQSWQARLDSEQRCREFAEMAAGWFWETDLQQVFTSVFPSSQSGWNSAALLGQHRRVHILDDPTGQIVAHIQRYMDRHEPFANFEYQTLDNEGQPLHLSVAGKPVHDASGQVIGYRGVVLDITEHLRSKARLRRAQQAEQHRHVQKMEALGTLAGGIAHDFNNILAAILGYTELTLYDTPPHSPAWQNLQEVLTAGKRAKDLVQQILTFSRKSEQERKPLRFHIVLKESLKLLRATLPTTIGIFQDISEDTSPILADTIQMQQVIMNLCANAEYAMRKTGGLLQVRLEMVDVEPDFAAQHPRLISGPHIRLIVRDTGQGIAPEIMGRIFEPFFTTKDIGQGTGMGLAMVHGIVTSHGGAITVQSTPGKGTTFQIYLPCIETAVDGETLVEEPFPYGSGSILFVDDENSLAQVGQRLLEQLGYDVVVKTNSLEALGVFRIDPYRFDLVITDQTMPYVTGAALADKFRHIRPDIPIILCTGFSHTIDAAEAKTQGIDAFLMKPLMLRDLGRTIQKVLAQRTHGPATSEC